MKFINWFRGLPKAVHMAVFVTFLIIIFFYYPVGMIMMHKVDDSLEFDYSEFKLENGSESVAAMSALIDREVNKNHFTPNDPIFVPASMLDRMPAFQRGVIAALSRFAVELTDQVGRTRGSSQADPDLEKAGGLLKYAPDIWIFDFSTSILPTASSEEQYRAALEALTRYNTRLAKGEAVFERRADNLLDTLDRIAADLGSASAAIDHRVRSYSGKLIDSNADVQFYEIKGKLYAYYVVFKALSVDYANIIRERELTATWEQTIQSLGEGAALSHFFVINASPNSALLPNHLTSQGFYLMRARTQLREITSILQK